MSRADLSILSWRFDDRAFNKGDLSVVDELIDPHFVNHDPLPGQGADREALRAYVPQLRTAIPDLVVRNDLMVVQGDLVGHVIVFEGIFAAPLGAMAPTGERVMIRAHDFQRWHDGRMTERWSVARQNGFGDGA